MDEVIFEEFKGTGNSELILDRKVSDKRIFPAIDIIKSGTRKEELIGCQKNIYRKCICLRRILSPNGHNGCDGILDLIRLKNTKNNDDFFHKYEHLILTLQVFVLSSCLVLPNFFGEV